MKIRTSCEESFKAEAVKLAKEIGVSKASSNLEIPENTIRNWLRLSETRPENISTRLISLKLFLFSVVLWLSCINVLPFAMIARFYAVSLSAVLPVFFRPFAKIVRFLGANLFGLTLSSTGDAELFLSE